MEQAEAIETLVDRTLEDLYKQDPKARDAVAQSVGYVVMSTTITKIPVVGVGSGYGVAIDSKSGKRTYLRMSRFDVGGGWGARSLRPVLIFHDEKVFRELLDGAWETQVGAEASAKVGESGAAGGGGNADVVDKGYTVHVITDAGVSATVTAGIIRVKPVKLKD